MGLFDLFKRTFDKINEPRLHATWTDVGVSVEFAKHLNEPSVEAILDCLHDAEADETILGAYLVQLASEGRCSIEHSGVLIPWEYIYELLASAEHQGALLLLGLPPEGCLRPIIGSYSTLSDPNFMLEIIGWTDGQHEIKLERLDGAAAIVKGKPELLSQSAWTTMTAIARFRSREESQRCQHENELSWGKIRQCADLAGAFYATPYLQTTYVLTPQTLRLPLAKEETPFGRVFTVAPSFDGAPDGWLRAFDAFNSVQPHYDLTRGAGRIRIVISEPVRKVLEVIKHEMPGRRVAGSRAEKFIHNPWAFLGDSAHEVIREDEFTADIAEAGSVSTTFRLISRTEQGTLNYVDLLITEYFVDETAQTQNQSFTEPEQLEDFIVALEKALQQDRERFPWNEYDLSIDAETKLQLDLGKQLLHLWRIQPAKSISLGDIYQMDGYSDRIEGIGAAKPIYVPVFQKPSTDDKEENGWLPSDLIPMMRVTLQGHENQILIPLSKQWVDDFNKQVNEAEQNGKTEVVNSSLPTPISTIQARTLIDSFRSMLGAQERVRGDEQNRPKEKKGPRETLLIKMNFHGVDYIEDRSLTLALPNDKEAELPNSLRPSIKLKKHQIDGIAWFQNLVSKAPTECRGALLADDMGLGKTLQLLSVLGWHYERNPNAAPSVIFAPKSLLENWANEASKFFTPAFPEILVLYGEELKARKQPLGLIDEQLRKKDIVELLKPDWVGNAKIIVTTYEVLTSFEFSFAKQPFAFVICDEAQRIKTPGTLVTLAAKKLNANFRIACTGTPVENSLADLWCLFDFIQPGLLGDLESFGKTYRRPIECETEAQRDALEQLQAVIKLQTLRRTKVDIAADAELKKKYFAFKSVNETTLQFKERLSVSERLDIAITEHQRVLYKGGLKKLQDAAKESNGRKRAQLSFGALHLMKAVCAEPYCLPSTKFLVDKGGQDVHLKNSPKLKWLLEQLQEIRKVGEKAIIFTELREAQAALYYFIRETFGLKPFIINGDSQGRQNYINKFSAKEGFDIIILSTLAAGAGLNVTAANHVFHFTRAWNPAKESQATDRAYRIGQDRDVFVYCPTVVAGDFHTFEEKLDELMKRKAGLAESTLGNAMVDMLNGTGLEAKLTELIDSDYESAELPRRYLTMDDVDRMDGFSFEVLCCHLWKKRGFQSNITNKKRGDGGIDIVAIRGREGELLQCKSSVNSEIGWDAIKEVTAGAARYQARFSGTRFRKVAVTNQRFTSGAIDQAEANHVHLVTRRELQDWISTHPVTNYEFDEELLGWLPLMKGTAS